MAHKRLNFKKFFIGGYEKYYLIVVISTLKINIVRFYLLPYDIYLY